MSDPTPEHHSSPAAETVRANGKKWSDTFNFRHPLTIAAITVIALNTACLVVVYTMLFSS